MMFTIEEAAAITGGKITGVHGGVVRGVATDSRTVQPGELFVPLIGEHFDGHDFIPAVAAKGITVALAKEGRLCMQELPENFTLITVADTMKALGDLAAAYRLRFSVKVIGVTGSNGKTTTKEMLASILEQSAPGLKTQGNLNNLIGLPQMLFKLKTLHSWAVLEMGMSEPGEIDRLAEIAAPEIGIVLNAFPAHLESMGRVENVARAKGELLLRIPAGGVAVINADDPLIVAQPLPAGVRRISFGIEHGDLRASSIKSLGVKGQRLLLHLDAQDYALTLKAYGIHNVYNALAAAAAAHAAGVTPEAICSGLENFRPFDKRFALEELPGIVLIDDSYNANPASMNAALATLGELKGKQRAYVAMGDMLEMGSDELKMHHALGVQAAQVADRLYLIGELTAETAKGALEGGMKPTDIIRIGDHGEAVDDILSHVEEGDFVLIKGSRGMKMDKIAEGIRTKKRG